MTNPHLLVVDDDERLRLLLSKFLEENGFSVTTACHAAAASKLLNSLSFDLVILDIMMPGESGLDLLARLRKEGNTSPILLLTAMGEVEDRLQGFRKGADEYLAKPFEPEELLLRIQAILRRTHLEKPLSTHEISIGPFVFHRKKKALSHLGATIHLTDVESNLLSVLVNAQEEPVSREALIEKTRLTTNPRAVDVQITRLRKKIEEDPKQPKYLQTIRNQGYVLWAH